MEASRLSADAKDAPGHSPRPPAGMAERLPNSVVARLARTAAGRRTLARWHTVTSGYAHASPAGSAGNPFDWQEEDITVQPRPGGGVGAGIRYLRHSPAAPALKVSADNSIAMQETQGEAKEVYLDPAVRAAANGALAAQGSTVELGAAGHTVTINAYGGAPQRVLEKARPRARAGAPNEASINAMPFAPIAEMICRDAAQKILGGTLTGIRLEYRTPGAAASRTVAADASGPEIVGGSQQLAAAVAKRQLSLDDAAAKIVTAKEPAPGKAYGRATRKEGFQARARSLGINEHAWARPGQAYCIQSTFTKDRDRRNYSSPDEAPVAGFGYHFGAVVAEALDGSDAVTLENYRRTGEVEAAATRLLAHLRATFVHHLTDAFLYANIPAAFEPRDQERVGAILHYLQTNTQADFNQASTQWHAITDEGFGGQSSLGTMWFFRMVGRDRPDQSFHRQLSRSGMFASPITFVMVR